MIQATIAKITNPALQGPLGTDTTGEETTATLLATIIRMLFIIGAIFFLIYILIAGINWITAEGKPEKVEKARKQLIDAIIGLVILGGVIALTSFLGRALNIPFLETLNFTIPTVNSP